MTSQRNFKARVRAYAAEHGLSYTQARQAMLDAATPTLAELAATPRTFHLATWQADAVRLIIDTVTGDGRHEDLVQRLATLDERSREILTLRYGLADGVEHTLEEIADQVGLQPARIRQLERRALKALQDTAPQQLPVAAAAGRVTDTLMDAVFGADAVVAKALVLSQENRLLQVVHDGRVDDGREPSAVRLDGADALFTFAAIVAARTAAPVEQLLEMRRGRERSRARFEVTRAAVDAGRVEMDEFGTISEPLPDDVSAEVAAAEDAASARIDADADVHRGEMAAAWQRTCDELVALLGRAYTPAERAVAASVSVEQAAELTAVAA